jgi:hypothetical protein
VKVLDTYPNVGMLTSRPYHSIPDLYTACLEWAQGNPDVKVETGRLINSEWMREFLLSLSRTEEEMLEDISQVDVKLTYRGVSTFCGASHWQFLAWKKVLQEFLPIDLSKPLGQVLRLDKMVNERGYLRLMTDQPYVMNLSNSVELPNTASPAAEPQTHQRLWDFPLIKSPLMRLYHAIFRLYYDR